MWDEFNIANTYNNNNNNNKRPKIKNKSKKQKQKNNILFTTCMNIILINAESISSLAFRVKICVYCCIPTKKLKVLFNLMGSLYKL